MARVEIAYSLIVLLVFAASGVIAYLAYHSRGRAYRRRTSRERAASVAAQVRREAEAP